MTIKGIIIGSLIALLFGLANRRIFGRSERLNII